MLAAILLLSILKVIGIVLLIILAVVVCLVLLILFMPVRWKVHAETDHVKKDLDVKARWLFGVFTFTLRYEDGGFPYAVKLFGHQIYPKKEG
ncbi:MAG: hypothetical protein IKD88_09335 [Lachnospiraceae bacterium]|nr:hypothetical protein [Lachnospiraceae bacterium]